MSDATLSDLEAILYGAAVAPLNAPGYEPFARGFLRITGADATRWLNGMVTNSVQSLQPGEGNYNFLLNAQGRIQADCTIYREPTEGQPTFLLESGRSQLETIHETLDRFIIMDEVELETCSYESLLLLIGPNALRVLRSQSQEGAPPFLASGDIAGRLVVSTQGEILLSEPATRTPVVTIASRLNNPAYLQPLEAAGAVVVSPAALEAFRIFSGVPRYGQDIRDRDLPQETNQLHALHFSKGCYLGQEIVERIRSRGQVHRLFTRFRLEGKLPATLPVPLEAQGKAAGELTSAILVPLPEGPQIFALGVARREFLDTRQSLLYPGGTAVPSPASNPTTKEP